MLNLFQLFDFLSRRNLTWQHDWRSEEKQRPKLSPFLVLPAKFWIFTTVRNVSRGSNEETNEGLAEVTAVRCFLHCINMWPMGKKLLNIQTQSHFTSHPHISEEAVYTGRQVRESVIVFAFL